GPTTPATRIPLPNQPIAIRNRRQFNPSSPVTPIRYRTRGKRPTSAPGSGQGGKGRKDNRVDIQSSESNVEQPEPPKTPVLQLRRPSAAVEGVEGRGARQIKYTTQFQSITNKRRL